MRPNLDFKATGARMTLVVMCLLVAIPAVAFAAAKLSSQSVTRNGITATVTYKQGPYFDTDTHIAISQQGVSTFKQSVNALLCKKDCEVTPKHALTIANLEGSSHADDVVLALYSGGAHCCTIDEVYSRDSSGYKRSQYDFGDPGAELKAIGPDHTVQFLTADDAFAYAFTDYAESGLPVEVLSFANGAFTNVTRTHPTLIRKDARVWWKAYLSDHDSGRAGLIAAWVADEDNLGQAKQARATLAAQVAKHRITQTFVNELEKFLKQHHYTS